MSREKEDKSYKELQEMAQQLPRVRIQFAMEVEATCLEVTNIAQQISSAIGDVSIDEAKDAIIREFARRLKT